MTFLSTSARKLWYVFSKTLLVIAYCMKYLTKHGWFFFFFFLSCRSRLQVMSMSETRLEDTWRLFFKYSKILSSNIIGQRNKIVLLWCSDRGLSVQVYPGCCLAMVLNSFSQLGLPYKVFCLRPVITSFSSSWCTTKWVACGKRKTKDSSMSICTELFAN